MGKIMHGDQVYSGGGGSVVQANPSDTASANLEKVKIDGTTYAIPSGGGGSVDDVQVDNVSVVDQNGVAHINTMTGAGSSSAGAKGLVPAPASGDDAKFLAGDGTWKTPQSGSQTLGGLTDVELTSPSAGQALLFDGTEWVNGTPSGGASAVSDLTDVDLNNLANGQILKYNSTTQKWENANESGGGGGGGGIVIIPITGGDNTFSRTFSFQNTPKHISVTYDSADSSPWVGHWEFTWGDEYAFGICNPKGIGQGGTIVRAGLTYGADNKSFTVTGQNAFQAWNQSGSVRGGFMLVDYGGGSGGSSTLAGLSDVDLETTPPTDGQILVYDSTNQIWVNADNAPVVANPAGQATAELTKISIGGVIYSLPQGGGGSSEVITGNPSRGIDEANVVEEISYEIS